ncbi:MAG TPA: GAF domain-containing protein [Anaerolineae bacterium]|nr:GAF domain-containing protein [Anaerolineae bacterium]
MTWMWLAAIGVFVVLIVVTVGIILRQRHRIQNLLINHRMLERRIDGLTNTQMAGQRQLARQAEMFAQRMARFRAAALVARDAAAIRDLDELMQTLVALISQQFDFYHAGIFLLDDAGDFAVMQAASSEGGRRMLARGHKLRVAEQGMVGYVAARGEARIALNVGEDPTWTSTLELPETRSEMALPLKIREQVIGVLDVQSTEPHAFSQEDVEILQTMADQLALAIQGARLFEENRRTVERLEMLYREQMGEMWRSRVGTRTYTYDGLNVARVWEEGVPEGMDGRHVVTSHQLVIPIFLRDHVIGSITLERDPVQLPWSDEEVALVEEIGVQAGLALDNAQLLTDSRQRATYQQQLSDVSRVFSGAVNMETMLQAAVRELGRLPGVAEVAVHIDAPQTIAEDIGPRPNRE